MIVVKSIEEFDRLTGPEARVDGRMTEENLLAVLELVESTHFVEPLTMTLVFTDRKEFRRIKPRDLMPAILDPFVGTGCDGEFVAALMDADDRLARQFLYRVLGDMGGAWDYQGASARGDRVSLKTAIRNDGDQRLLAHVSSPFLPNKALAWVAVAIQMLGKRKVMEHSPSA